MDSPPADRRTQAKARHRAAIVAAAAALIAERGSGGFSTDDLAERADVSRRTVFNHFASLEDVVVACVESELAVTTASVREATRDAGPCGSALDALEAALRGVDLATAISRISGMLAGPAQRATGERVRQEAMRRIANDLVQCLRPVYPHEPPLHLELMTGSVMSGLGVVAEAWAEQTPGALDAGARRRWDELLDHLFSTLRHGFQTPPVTRTTDTTTPPEGD